MSVLDDQLKQEDIAYVAVTNLVVIKHDHEIVASIFVRIDETPIKPETGGNGKEARRASFSTA